MTFEEWWTQNKNVLSDAAAFKGDFRDAWVAATAAEREAIATLLIEAAEALERTPHGHGQAEHLRTAAACVRAR